MQVYAPLYRINRRSYWFKTWYRRKERTYKGQRSQVKVARSASRQMYYRSLWTATLTSYLVSLLSFRGQTVKFQGRDIPTDELQRRSHIDQAWASCFKLALYLYRMSLEQQKLRQIGRLAHLMSASPDSRECYICAETERYIRARLQVILSWKRPQIT